MLQTAQNLADVMKRVGRRDRRAFAELYQATSAKLYGIVFRILGEKAVADEVLQEVYVKIWERAADFDAARASPITWMAAIARNRALDEVRRRKPDVPALGRGLEEMPDNLEFAAATDHPLDPRERSEELARLMLCLGGLEPNRREMLLLAYYRGMSREALGERFAAPVSTVKTWLRRSLAQLRDCLSR
ncbi:MAG: sigma-70 family RNA polymerase sigma factor [Methylobacteriaceae bacterium]|nr:sigma-70 family RNA polymerase sigma factor [Methylobacteriaceae bacterium]MBV9704980.1 sigma-70 family RNA polymerase sigma factor [Methylobacteriaceae bacterium]